MNIKIVDKTSYDLFLKNIDVDDLTLTFNKEEVNQASGYWSIDESESLILTLFKDGISLGRSKLFMYHRGLVRTKYNRSRIASYVIRYDNAKITINIDNNNMICGHLYKNNEIAITSDNETFTIPWHLIYKEVIRISKRNNKTTHLKEIKKVTKEMKILGLMNELIEAGIDSNDCKKAQYGDLVIIKIGNKSMRVELTKRDTNDMNTYDYEVSIFNLTYHNISFKDIAQLYNTIKGLFICY